MMIINLGLLQVTHKRILMTFVSGLQNKAIVESLSLTARVERLDGSNNRRFEPTDLTMSTMRKSLPARDRLT